MAAELEKRVAALERKLQTETRVNRGHGLAYDFFMLALLLRQARGDTNPAAWVRAFMDDLHRLLDDDELRPGFPAPEIDEQQLFEEARLWIDANAGVASRLLERPAQQE